MSPAAVDKQRELAGNSIVGKQGPGQRLPRLSFFLDGAHTAESMATCAHWFADASQPPAAGTSAAGVGAAGRPDTQLQQGLVTQRILLFNCMQVHRGLHTAVAAHRCAVAWCQQGPIPHLFNLSARCSLACAGARPSEPASAPGASADRAPGQHPPCPLCAPRFYLHEAWLQRRASQPDLATLTALSVGVHDHHSCRQQRHHCTL